MPVSPRTIRTTTKHRCLLFFNLLKPPGKNTSSSDRFLLKTSRGKYFSVLSRVQGKRNKKTKTRPARFGGLFLRRGAGTWRTCAPGWPGNACASLKKAKVPPSCVLAPGGGGVILAGGGGGWLFLGEGEEGEGRGLSEKEGDASTTFFSPGKARAGHSKRGEASFGAAPF